MTRAQRIALAVWRRRKQPRYTLTVQQPYGITENPATWFYIHPATYDRLKLTDRSIPCS